MPRYRSSGRYRRRPRRRYRRRPYKKPARYQVADMAYSGYKLAKKLASLVNVEMKTHTETLGAANFDQDGTMDIINDVPSGDTRITRDGSSLKCQKLHINLSFNAVTVSSKIRFLIIHDKQNSVSTPQAFWDDDTWSTGWAPLGFKNADTIFESKTLYDSGVVDLIVGTEKEKRNYDLTLPLGFHTQFQDGSTTINTGALKIFYISDTSTTNMPQIQYVSRVFFTDN